MKKKLFIILGACIVCICVIVAIFFSLKKTNWDDVRLKTKKKVQSYNQETNEQGIAVDMRDNPYYKNSSKLSMLEAYCLNAEPDYYFVPLFLLIDSGKTSLNTTTLSMIIKTIAQNVANAKSAELVALYNYKKNKKR